MTDQQLLHKILVHCAMGAFLGCTFSGTMMFLNIARACDLVLGSATPLMTAIVIVGGSCVYFAFGAAVTGFHFIFMDAPAGP
ncbi:hypothetical protein [Tardiphaga sp. P9-11]|uniref:hypothetical protein n=1 Tax=Tardiphaga sp. P9-11 TaxID=2024614 RepID=UPI0011F20D12|nr:hypothetical protein [Tardiphaga sp. P9-11]KAA0073988.1 hypothetical protein CIW50_18805 [Tardiphaga sp. P9-11]